MKKPAAIFSLFVQILGCGIRDSQPDNINIAKIIHRLPMPTDEQKGRKEDDAFCFELRSIFCPSVNISVLCSGNSWLVNTIILLIISTKQLYQDEIFSLSTILLALE